MILNYGLRLASEPRRLSGSDDAGSPGGRHTTRHRTRIDGLPATAVAPPSPDFNTVQQIFRHRQFSGEDEHEPLFIQGGWLRLDYPMDGGDDGDDDDGERLARCTAPPAHSPPLPPSSGCLTQIQTLRIASTQALIDAVTAALPPPPLPPSLPIPSPIWDRESTTARLQSQGIDYGFVSTVDAEERRQGIRDVGYGIRDTWVDPAEAVPEIAPMTVGEVNTRVVELAELHERDTQDLYALLEDAQDGRSRISQRVDMNSQRVDLLMGDRMTLQETVWMVEEEAYASREAWARSIGLEPVRSSGASAHRVLCMQMRTYLTGSQIRYSMHSCTLNMTQHQDQMVETLRVIRDMRREMSDMQAELLALREQRRTAGQSGPEARIPDHQEASGDADSHI
ncbi:hypothetical protein Tco_0401408 [Tanacetum coccineum]